MNEVEEIVVRYVDAYESQPAISRFASYRAYRTAKVAWEDDYAEALAALREIARDLRRGP